MATVYQLGNTVIMKDMVFGWCISRPDIGTVLCSDLPIESLKELAEADYPAYLADFKKDMGVILEMNLLLEEKKKEIIKESDQKNSDMSAEQMAADEKRAKDIANLADEIRDNLSSEIYGIYNKLESPYVYCYVSQTQKNSIAVYNSEKGYLDSFYTPEQVAEYIARRFW